MTTDHTTIRLSAEQKQRLTDLAAEFGYTRNVNGVEVPDRSGFIQAIADGELRVVRTSEEHQ